MRNGLERIERDEKLLVALFGCGGSQEFLHVSDHLGGLSAAVGSGACRGLGHGVKIVQGRGLGGEFVGCGFHGNGDWLTGEVFD